MHPSATATQTATQVEWYEKEDAAKELKRSVRWILQEYRDGRLKGRKVPNPASGQEKVQISAPDVARILHERENPTDMAVSPGIVKAMKERAAQVQQLPAPAEIPNKLGLPHWNPHCWPPLLTLREACEYWNVPKAFLLDPKSPFKAVDLGGPARGGRWRFHRDSLEKA